MRTLQLKRFDKIFSSHDIAAKNLSGISETLKDGEVALSAYYGDTGKTAANIKYIVGIKVSKDGKENLFKIDVDSIEQGMQAASKYITGITQVTASTYTTANTDTYKTTTANGDNSSFRLKFTPISGAKIATAEAFGDIPANTPASALTGCTISEILDKMLFKTVYPRITRNPSVSLSLNDSLCEPGTIIKANATYVYGLIKNGDGSVVPYTPSSATAIAVTDSKGTAVPTSGVSVTTLGDNVFTAKATYGVGTVFKDNKGNSGTTIYDINGNKATVANPNTGGTVTTTRKVNVSLPVYYGAGTSAAKKLDLKNWGASTWIGQELPAFSPDGKLFIKVPSGRTFSKVAVLTPGLSPTSESSYSTVVRMEKVSDETIGGMSYAVYKSADKTVKAGQTVTQLQVQKYLIKIG